MSFDFDAAERELSLVMPPMTLRERAAVAFTERQQELKRQLLVAAQDTIHEVLGETNAEEIRVELDVTIEGNGKVEMEIDGIRFRVVRRIITPTEKDEESEPYEDRYLEMGARHQSWRRVNDLETVGKILATDPTYTSP